MAQSKSSDGEATGHPDSLIPPKPHWSFSDIPDLTGKVIIVTGGNSGLGKETVKQLLLHNAKVYLATRSPERAAEAIAELREQTGKEALFLQLDLANLKTIKATVDEFTSKETELHVLFNNGSVMWTPIHQLTTDGYDLQFGTNVVGPFYLTKLLLPILISTAKNYPEWGRVVNVSSMSYVYLSGKSLHYETFRDSPARKRLGTIQLYFQSKWAIIIYALELHRRYADQGIISSSLHPGTVRTGLSRHTSFLSKLFMRLIYYPTWMGAITQLWAGTSPEGATFGGRYLTSYARLGKPLSGTQDPEEGRKLWEWLEDQVKDL